MGGAGRNGQSSKRTGRLTLTSLQSPKPCGLSLASERGHLRKEGQDPLLGQHSGEPPSGPGWGPSASPHLVLLGTAGRGGLSDKLTRKSSSQNTLPLTK